MSATLHEIFLENVKRRLRELSISQRQFADLMAVSEQHISQLLAGRNVPKLDLVERVAGFLKTTPQYLLTPANLEEIPISLPGRVDTSQLVR